MQRLLIDVHALARRWWDADRGLLTNPGGRHGDVTRGRGEVGLLAPTVWWAHGLLTRQREGDVELAHTALRTVLGYGGIDVETATALALVARDHELPRLLDRDLSVAVVAAVREAPEVDPCVTHLAVLHAWLELEVARWRADDELFDRGSARVRAVTQDTQDRGHVAEHVSPADTGRTLLGLSLWAARPPTPGVAPLGEALRDEVWQTLLAAWHPGLLTLVPPFTRTFGMDLREHVASVAPWLVWLIDGAYPLPPLTEADIHQGQDLLLAFAVDALAGAGTDVLELAPLVRAQPARQGTWVDEVGERRWTGWTGPSIAVGAETSPAVAEDGWMRPTAAAVWHQPDHHNAWLRLHGTDGSVAARVHQEDEVVHLVRHVQDASVRLLLGGCAPTLVTPTAIEHGGRTWTLEGVTAVQPVTSPSAPDAVAEWVLDVPDGTVTCTTSDR